MDKEMAKALYENRFFYEIVKITDTLKFTTDQKQVVLLVVNSGHGLSNSIASSLTWTKFDESKKEWSFTFSLNTNRPFYYSFPMLFPHSLSFPNSIYFP